MPKISIIILCLFHREEITMKKHKIINSKIVHKSLPNVQKELEKQIQRILNKTN